MRKIWPCKKYKENSTFWRGVSKSKILRKQVAGQQNTNIPENVIKYVVF